MQLPVLTLVALAARNAAGNGDWQDLAAVMAANGLALPPGPRVLRLQVEITALSGTASPTLTVFVEDCLDGDGTHANNVGATAGLTATGRTVLTIGPRGDAYPANFAWPFNHTRCRVRWTISGTNPSFTFSVKGVLL